MSFGLKIPSQFSGHFSFPRSSRNHYKQSDLEPGNKHYSFSSSKNIVSRDCGPYSKCLSIKLNDVFFYRYNKQGFHVRRTQRLTQDTVPQSSQAVTTKHHEEHCSYRKTQFYMGMAGTLPEELHRQKGEARSSRTLVAH